mmetsp:Transcript_53807/g.139047  ORF Transcript_53807/g.139047 Transcript_53807/m.139047 type:complete len:414 (+) Transcript_53807:211-1452(+)
MDVRMQSYGTHKGAQSLSLAPSAIRPASTASQRQQSLGLRPVRRQEGAHAAEQEHTTRTIKSWPEYLAMSRAHGCQSRARGCEHVKRGGLRGLRGGLRPERHCSEGPSSRTREARLLAEYECMSSTSDEAELERTRSTSDCTDGDSRRSRSPGSSMLSPSAHASSREGPPGIVGERCCEGGGAIDVLLPPAWPTTDCIDAERASAANDCRCCSSELFSPSSARLACEDAERSSSRRLEKEAPEASWLSELVESVDGREPSAAAGSAAAATVARPSVSRPVGDSSAASNCSIELDEGRLPWPPCARRPRPKECSRSDMEDEVRRVPLLPSVADEVLRAPSVVGALARPPMPPMPPAVAAAPPRSGGAMRKRLVCCPRCSASGASGGPMRPWTRPRTFTADAVAPAVVTGLLLHG